MSNGLLFVVLLRACYCHSSFTFPLGVIGRRCIVIDTSWTTSVHSFYICQTGYSQIHGTNNTMVMRSYPSSAGRIISNIVQGGRMQLKMRPTPSGFCQRVITKTCLYNIDTLKPHFYIVKLGFTGVYIIFLISAQNIDCWYSLEPPRHIDCWYSLEPPRRGGSNEYQQSMF